MPHVGKTTKFWAKVDKNGPVDHMLQTRCWLWLGATNQRYGHMRPEAVGIEDWPTTLIYAHYAAWVIAGNQTEKGKKLSHLCENKLCVNPDHLHLARPGDRLILRWAVRKRAYRRARLRELWVKDLSWAELAEHLDVCEATVRKDAKALGLSRLNRRVLTPKQRDALRRAGRAKSDRKEQRRAQVLALLVGDPSLTTAQLAVRLGMSLRTTQRDLAHMGITTRSGTSGVERTDAQQS